MDVVSVTVFRSNFTEFAERAKAGHLVIVRKHGTPVAMLCKANAQKGLTKPIGLRELRFTLGRRLRGVKHGRTWLISVHGTAQLVLTRVPRELRTVAERWELEHEESA